ncbi:AMP-binding protein [Nonomuraea sp. NPDC050536]|uniref:AMP-binding protein n=1 Tax=Nonomuraea sp. NPDC050536 TaxID=3364366 RepID=UPI0037C935F8
MPIWETLATPDPQTAARYRAAGWWRESTFLDDLAGAAERRPNHPAIISYEGGEPAKTLTYAELADTVARFAGALRELGVGPGDVVVLYLPNLWMLTPLYLACNRIGAVSSPVIPVLGGRELAHVLRASSAKVAVTIDSFDGVDFAGRLVEAAPETLEHRVVVGDAAATGAIDFEEFFVRTDRDPGDPGDVVPLGPDDPALLLYTSGTTGTMKAVVHSQNTVYAAVRAVSEPYGLTEDDVISIPNYLTHMAGMSYAVYMPLHLGGTCVMQDTNTDMELLLDLIAAHRISWAYCAPGYLVKLLAGQRKNPRDAASLNRIVSGSAPIQPQLISDVREVFDIPLHALWGMTENGGVTVTRPDDPEGWAAHSDGRSMPWMEIKVVPDAEAEEGAGKLLVRGASQCLGYLGQRELYENCLDAEGWFDTGDLAREDGRGGIRITGRRVDLITRASGQKVSTLEVEAVLLRHLAVSEVVLVGYPDPAVPGADLVCAVVVSDGPPPSLEDLREHLAAEKMAKVLWPDRLQFVWQLPKNSLGKVLRQPLRERLEIAASPR